MIIQTAFAELTLIAKALRAGWQDTFLTSRAYADYAAERQAAGLA